LAIVEDSKRALTQLKNLAKGHALSQGRNYISTDDDISIVIQTVLSTCSIERSTIFGLLIANNGKLSTKQICDYLNTTKPTALRTMTELRAIGLVTMFEGDYTTPSEIVLKDEFDWFKGGCKEKLPPSTHTYYYNLIKNNNDNNEENDFIVRERGEISLHLPPESWANKPVSE
jgi:hypothetical protein